MAKKALHELEKVWIKLKSPPKNREIERLLAESNIDFPKAKDIGMKLILGDALLNLLELLA